MDRRDGWKLWLWLKGAAGGQERPKPLGSGARNIASGYQRHLSLMLFHCKRTSCRTVA